MLHIWEGIKNSLSFCIKYLTKENISVNRFIGVTCLIVDNDHVRYLILYIERVIRCLMWDYIDTNKSIWPIAIIVCRLFFLYCAAAPSLSPLLLPCACMRPMRLLFFLFFPIIFLPLHAFVSWFRISAFLSFHSILTFSPLTFSYLIITGDF